MTSGGQDQSAQDRQDMLRLAAGHASALDALMDRHGQRLFHYLLRQLQDESDATDLAQETFVRVFQHRERFRPEQKFTTWLYTIATNLVRDRFRWRQRHPEASLHGTVDEADERGGMLDALPAKGSSPDEHALAEERAALVRQAVAALPEDLRTALILSEYQDCSHAEIGAVLNCTAKAVENRLYRARALLRKRLEPGLYR
jgi:RNA polymerase sigma-70 factor (ECF subfamily)